MNARSPYIVGPFYDWAFFLLPPVLAVLAGGAIAGTRLVQEDVQLFGRSTTTAALVLGTIVHAHLAAVFFRSHGNPEVRRLYRWRFLVLPVVLYFVIVSSPVAGAAALVVATFWDVWHSGAQTFGLARIYDRNAGNAPEVGRRLDFWVNQVLYAGPILAGATMLEHIGQLRQLEAAGVAWFSHVTPFMERNGRWVSGAVLGGGAAFLAFYVGWYWVQDRRGYRVSPYKVTLLASTGLASLIAWGFDSWGEAFFIMNLLHAVQYLALVWAIEHPGLMQRLRLSPFRVGRPLLFCGFAAILVSYGAFAELLDPDLDSLWALTIVVSLVHFWYDGFIWSVRRAQV